MAALLGAVMLATVWVAPASQAAAPKLDTIRVAIVIDHARYKLNVPIVTLSSAGSLGVGFNLPTGVVPLFQTGTGESVRFTLDDFKVKVAESAQLATAQAIVKRLLAAGGVAYINAVPRNGGTAYQVMEGSYATAAAAATAVTKWNNDSGIAALNGKAATVAGPQHLVSGSYGTITEARQAAAVFGAAGVDAFLGMLHGGAEGGKYTVLVGAAIDAAALNAVNAKASAVGEVKSLAAGTPYVMLVDDYTEGSAKTLVAVPSGTAKAWVTTNASTGIKLTERYNRNYRGAFEISGANGKLTAINELPFEQYLYSVVGGEMPASWPAEALKAQAVAARTFALYQGNAFQMAHVVDTTLSQAYGGIGAEKPTTIKAVDATAGQVLLYKDKLIEALFSSSAGGATSEATEVWGNDVPYMRTVVSPDEVSEKGLYYWYRVVLPSGNTGYIREDLVEATSEKTAAGSAVMRVKGDSAMVRPIPLVQDKVPVVDKASKGTRVVVLERVIQSNEMSWVRGPFTPQALQTTIKAAGITLDASIRTFETGKRGPSGRPLELLVNGKPLNAKYPDAFRTALGGLPSTRFQIDETARLTVAGANDKRRERPDGGSGLSILGANGKTATQGNNLFVMNGKGEIRATTKEPTYRFIGNGYGHGVGMSQYGARGLAEKGYDYSYILQYYYKDVKIAKD